MKVHFTSPGEFCAEITKDKDKIDRNIVRSTIRWEGSKMHASIQHVYAVASYSVDGQLVDLLRYCGDVWGVSSGRDHEVIELSQKYLKLVEDTCKGLKIECRAGLLQEDE